ncbi:glycosyltransferase [Butyrivibrio sp. AE2032]|uniref:glycosyltransferase n=1 Tax=Butyrivibrio sp. AE2032 TaxID=1458463 RepID=UPI0005516D89|nr:glycosyltransferase [Butyrivibrio sp. AE2032]
MEYKVSIVVPVYNAEKYLDRCMKTLLEQSMPKGEYEIILVDDGSPDESGKMCDNYAKNYDFVTVIHQTNAGPAAARNAGLAKASGKFIAFIDPDDFIDRKYLEVAYAQGDQTNADIVLFDAYREKHEGGIEKREYWGHAGSGFVSVDEQDIRSMQRQILYPYMAATAGKIPFKRNVPLAAPWDKLYRRSFLGSNHLTFPAQLKVLDDMCFNFKTFGMAKNISYIPTPLYHYQVEATSITNSYREDRVQQDIQVFNYLKEQIDEMGMDRGEDSLFKQALYARIIKSFVISLRLYFLNPQNPKTKTQIDQEIRTTIESMPYKQAFDGIHLLTLEPKLVIATMACKAKNVRLLRLLFKLQYR